MDGDDLLLANQAKLIARLIAKHPDLERRLLAELRSKRQRLIFRAVMARAHAEIDEEIASLKRML